MTNGLRARVDGWRWDFLTPWGWLPSTGVKNHYNIPGAGEPQGWYLEEQAVCFRSDHPAPDPDCVCGLHGIERLTPAVADQLDRLSSQRERFIAMGAVPDSETLVIALSHVTLEGVLPSAWPDDDAAKAAHPEAFPDPPHTIRGHRKKYREVFVDRDWPALPDGWPADKRPENSVSYVPDLAAAVRGYTSK